MALVTGSWTVDSSIFVATLLYLAYWYFSSSPNYFESRGIPYVSFEGSNDTFYHPSNILGLYRRFPGERFYGYYQGRVPILFVKDPELNQRIMMKDFGYFYDRGFKGLVTEGDVMAQNIFFLRGQSWRALRNKLLPTFTSGKLKIMFSQFSEIADHVLEDIEESPPGEPVDVKLTAMNFATEVIASSAFGMNYKKDDAQSIEFTHKINKIFPTGFRQKILSFLVLYIPKLLQMAGFSLFTPGIFDYFLNMVRANIKYRKENNVRRNDYFQQLISLQEAEERGESLVSATGDNEEDALINQMEHAPESSYKEIKLFTDEGITAQVVGFLMAGTETVTMVVSHSLYHIAKDPTIQKTLVHELDSTLAKHGCWTYQAVKQLTYLDQILQETLRLYSVLPLNFRECTSPYQIPNTDIVLEKGTVVAIPVGGLHMDPNFHSNPEIFDPERFVGNNFKPNEHFMPFGNGPRICIAMRFALLEVKVCLAKMLSKYLVAVSNKTLEPLVFEAHPFTPKCVGGIWITFEKRLDKLT